MPNPDRGAYLPPNEEPLTFDARRPVRGRAPMPIMLIISAAILFVLLIGLLVILRSSFGRVSGSPPMVGNPIEAMKSPAPAEAQPDDPARGLQIYQQAEGETPPVVPNFTPPQSSPKLKSGSCHPPRWPTPQGRSPPDPQLRYRPARFR